MADTESHLSRKQTHVSANLTGGSISNAFHGVIAALLFVEETESGRNRLRSPFSGARTSSAAFYIVRKAKSRASGPQNRVTQCEPGAHVHLSSDAREPANSLGLGPRRARGSTGVSDQFIAESGGQRAKSPSKARKCAANEFGNSSAYALCSPLMQPCSSTVRASAFEAEGWWCESTRGCQFHAHVVQQQRQPSQKRFSAGATPAVGTNHRREQSTAFRHFALSSQLPAPVAQCRGRRFKPGVSVSATLTGSTTSSLCSPTAETSASKPAQRGCNWPLRSLRS